MKTFASAILAVSLLALTACGETPNQESADDFAARIGSGSTTSAQQDAAGQAAGQETQPGTASAPAIGTAGTAGTAADAQAACGAVKVAQFIGKLADEATRTAVRDAATDASEIRFVSFGGIEFINPDPTDPRLNLMLDEQNIIRDARCG